MAVARRAKRVMDVEDVVRWACREVGVKRAAPSLAGPGGLKVSRGDASLVGRWTWPAGFPEISPMFANGFATGGGRGVGISTPIDDDALLVAETMKSLSSLMGSIPAPEALALDFGLPVDVDGAFAAAIANVSNLVLACGRTGRRPILYDGPIETRPVLAPNGRPGIWREITLSEPAWGGRRTERVVEEPLERLRKDRYAEGAYCRIEYDPDPQGILNDRADYLAWRMGLDALAERLAGRLSGMAVMPPAAALAPWLGDKDGDKPRDLFGAGAERVYSATEQNAIARRREGGGRRPITVARRKARRPTRPEAKMARG